MSLHYYILTFNLIVLGLTLQALGPKFISHLLESIFSCIILSIVSLWNMGVLVHYNKGKSSLTGWGGVSKTQTSKLQTSDLRPQTSKLQTSKTQTPWKLTEIVNAVLHECIYFFTIIIIVTNPQVSYIFIQNKNENDKNNGKIISLSRV